MEISKMDKVFTVPPHTIPIRVIRQERGSENCQSFAKLWQTDQPTNQPPWHEGSQGKYNTPNVIETVVSINFNKNNTNLLRYEQQ